MHRDSGNAFIYVLITVALFAALSFILIKQEDTREVSSLSPDTAKILASQLISTATQVKSALDQMTFSGTNPDEFDFTKPQDFGSAAPFDSVFHPDGGGVLLPPLPENAIVSVGKTSLTPAWYLGRFNQIEWTKSEADDVILSAYGLNRTLCQQINILITGDEEIPVLSGTARSVLVDRVDHGGANSDFTASICPICDGKPSFCVQDGAGDLYVFYNVLFGE